MPLDHETTRVSNLSDQELLEYIDSNGTDSPERKHALHVLEDRHQRKNQEKLAELIQITKRASDSPKSLRKTLWKFVKILWAPVAIISTAIGIWNKEFWDFISSIWHAVIR